MNFASSKKPFSVTVLRNLIYKVKTEADLEPIKVYITSYFAPLSTEVLYWKPKENEYEALSDREVKARFLRNDTAVIQLPPGPDGKPQKIEFNVRNWFFITYPIIYSRGFNVRELKLYKIDGQIYINSFAGFLYTKTKLFSEYSQKLREGVNFINKHIQTVWCSNNKILTEYTLNWIAHMISGRKMETVLFIQSPQGSGKGTITEFIQEKVLGDKIVKITSDPNIISGTFNKEIEGHILLILEEMPTGKNEWHTFSQRMKHLITGRKIEIHEKNKTPYSLDNNLSIIINTNNKNAIRLETGDRRYVYLDVSVERIGDTDYFDDLYEIMRLPGIGEAYYAYMLERAKNTPNFTERKIPRTNAKQDQIIDSLHKVHKYIKDIYLRSQRGINIPFSEFYHDYIQTNDDSSSRQRIRKILEDEVGLKTILIKKQNWYKISPVELYGAYDKKGFIHEIEEINPPDSYITPTEVKKSDPKCEKEKLETSDVKDSNSEKNNTKKLSPKPDYLKIKNTPEDKKPETPAESSNSSVIIESVENTPEVIEELPKPKNIWEYNRWEENLFNEIPEYIGDPEFEDPLHLYNMYVEETGDPPVPFTIGKTTNDVPMLEEITLEKQIFDKDASLKEIAELEAILNY
jgi:hypothetical protein